jgi:regulator of protease activity HflC (stomatin/prohibitin superfamily)
MGHQAQVKLLRKAVRNVAQRDYQSAMTSEAIVDLDKKFQIHAGERLDAIAKNVDKEMRTMDGQTREFRKLLMRDLSMQLSRELFGMNVSMLAWQKVLLQEMGITDVKNFEERVEAEKKEITAKLEAEAKAKAEADAAEAKKKAAEDAAAAAAKAAKEGTPVVESTETSAAATTANVAPAEPVATSEGQSA